MACKILFAKLSKRIKIAFFVIIKRRLEYIGLFSLEIQMEKLDDAVCCSIGVNGLRDGIKIGSFPVYYDETLRFT